MYDFLLTIACAAVLNAILHLLGETKKINMEFLGKNSLLKLYVNPSDHDDGALQPPFKVFFGISFSLGFGLKWIPKLH